MQFKKKLLVSAIASTLAVAVGSTALAEDNTSSIYKAVVGADYSGSNSQQVNVTIDANTSAGRG